MTTVVVAAASSSARAGLEALLARDPSLRVVAAASPGSALTVALDSGAPDVLLLEIAGDPAAALGAEIGSQLAEHASERLPAIVLLAEAVSAGAVAGALRAGARAVLRWDASPEPPRKRSPSRRWSLPARRPICASSGS